MSVYKEDMKMLSDLEYNQRKFLVRGTHFHGYEVGVDYDEITAIRNYVKANKAYGTEEFTRGFDWAWSNNCIEAIEDGKAIGFNVLIKMTECEGHKYVGIALSQPEIK